MATKNLFVYVPSNGIADYKSRHVTNVTSDDEYYSKIAFLSGSGEIATRGELFGMSTEFAQKLGLTSDITTSNTLMSYITGVKDNVTTLMANENTEGSVDKKIKTAIDNLIAGAPTAYDTITEIAAWINDIQGQQGTAATVAAQLAKIDPLVDKLGTYTNGAEPTYTGAYLFAHNAAVEEATAMKNSLTYSDTAVAGEYVSAVTQTNGVIAVTRASLPTLSLDTTANTGSQYVSGLSVSGHTITATYTALPTLSVASASQALVTVNDHQITLVTTDLGSTSGISHTTTNNVTTYAAGTQIVGDGLITASAVYNRIHATEEYLATTLTNLDSRIQATVTGTTGALDSTKTLNATDGSDTLGTITIVQKDGLLADTSEDGNTTASFTINKANILKDASATVDSPTTGTGANEYVQVHVTEENHKVTAVTVEFEAWENYTPSGN